MEPRKLIKLGNSSYAIALPKGWVDKSGLKKGDNVYVSPNSHGELILAPEQSLANGNKIKKLDVAQLDYRAIMNELRSAYVQDNDILQISGFSRDKKEFIKEVTQKELIGFEIINAHEGTMILQDFFNMQEIQLEGFLRKIDNSIRSMFEDLTAVTRGSTLKEKELADMYSTDLEINKFYLLITRVLFRGLNNPSVLIPLKIDLQHLFNYWWIAFNLEHIADEIKRITEALKAGEIKKNRLNILYTVCEKTNITYLHALQFYYKRDTQLGKGSLAETDKMRKSLNAHLQQEKGNFGEILMRFSMINRSIYEINKILFYALR